MRRWRLVLLVLAAAATCCATADATVSVQRFYSGEATRPGDVTQGPGGVVWFTWSDGIAQVGLDGHVSALRIPDSNPNEIVYGPDGALWYTESSRPELVRVGADDTVTRFSIGTQFQRAARSIAVGPDGALWFTTSAPAYVGRMTTSGTTSLFGPVPGQENLGEITTGPDGNLWFAVDRGVGRATPAGDLTLFPIGDLAFHPASDYQPLAAGSDGNVWAAQSFVLGPGAGALHRIRPDGSFDSVNVPLGAGPILGGPDGALWFLHYSGFGRYAPATSELSDFGFPFGSKTDCGPFETTSPIGGGLAFSSDGALWTADSLTDSLLRVGDDASVEPAISPLLRATGPYKGAHSLATGTHGSVWIAAKRAVIEVDGSGRRHAHRVDGRVDDLAVTRSGEPWFVVRRGLMRLTRDGDMRRVPHRFPPKTAISGLTAGPGGGMWYVDPGRTRVGYISARGKVRELSRGFGRHAKLLTIASGPGKTMWVTDQNGAIIRIRGGRHVRRFRAGLHRRAQPTAIVQGPDDRMWFTELGASRIGRISPSGQIEEFMVADFPAALIAGPDGALWFNTFTAGGVFTTTSGVGRITMTGQVTQFYVHRTCSASYHGLALAADGSILFSMGNGPVAVGRIDLRALRRTGAMQAP